MTVPIIVYRKNKVTQENGNVVQHFEGNKGLRILINEKVPFVSHRSETEIAQYRISHDKGIGGDQSVIQRYENTSDIEEKENMLFFSCKILLCKNFKTVRLF